MEKIDARSMTQDAQYQIRRQAVKMRQRAMQYGEIAEILGVSPTYVCRVCKRYEREGIQGIAKRLRGRRKGEQRHLEAEQETAITIFAPSASEPQLAPRTMRTAFCDDNARSASGSLSRVPSDKTCV